MPNCSEIKDDNGIPGPGAYTKDSQVSPEEEPKHDLNFLTTTRRQGFWDNNIDAPYTKATNKTVGPGPGKYEKDSK